MQTYDEKYRATYGKAPHEDMLYPLRRARQVWKPLLVGGILALCLFSGYRYMHEGATDCYSGCPTNSQVDPVYAATH